MEAEKLENLKQSLVRRLVMNASISDVMRVFHDLAIKDIDARLSEATEEQKESAYNEIFHPIEEPEQDNQEDENTIAFKAPDQE